MKINPGMEQEYQQFTDANSKNDYSRSMVRYMERWADMMETAIAGGATVAQAAESAGQEANTEGITGFQFVCAVEALSHFWPHGEALRQWHNHRYHYDGQGTVNPTILSFGE